MPSSLEPSIPMCFRLPMWTKTVKEGNVVTGSLAFPTRFLSLAVRQCVIAYSMNAPILQAIKIWGLERLGTRLVTGTCKQLGF